MASNDWHVMNNIMAEIERNRDKIESLTVHCSLNKASTLRKTLHSLQDQQYRLYNQIADQAEVMIEKLDKAGL